MYAHHMNRFSGHRRHNAAVEHAALFRTIDRNIAILIMFNGITRQYGVAVMPFRVAKMSLTDYERYMNAKDGTPEKSEYLKAHVASVRAQVKRLARKEYTKYLPDGYNRLNFAIMYVPIEGALNLALLNDSTLWREAYDEGVMILGPQTMYMNLRVLEMMWTQVRQLSNQQAMMDAANVVVERVQDFGMRFIDVETSMNNTMEKMTKLKVSTAESGRSIITAAKSLLKAGAKENKKKKSLDEMDNTVFIESNE